MTYNDIVLHALRVAGQPLASHQLYELPACEGMTRQQVSSAVGHLRRAGKIKETWGTVPGPQHGPKEVRQYEVTPQEDGLDEALIAALAASANPTPPLTAAAQAEQSRQDASRPPREDRAIPRTVQPAKPAVGHPFTRPISPKAPADRHGRITRDLPAHLVETVYFSGAAQPIVLEKSARRHLVNQDARLDAAVAAIYGPTPAVTRLEQEEATRDESFISADVAAEAEAEATTAPEATTGADGIDLDDIMLGIVDDISAHLAPAAPDITQAALGTLGDEALLIHTDLDAALAGEIAARRPDPIATPTEDTAITAETHHCRGQCQGHDQGKTAIHDGHGDPRAVPADADRDQATATAEDDDRAMALDRPAWVADLQAWLGPLPTDLGLTKITSRLSTMAGPGQLKLGIVDDGGGAFVEMDARRLYLNSGEIGQLDRYSRALIWVFEAITANTTLLERATRRPSGLDHPILDDLFDRRPPDGASHADNFRAHAPF